MSRTVHAKLSADERAERRSRRIPRRLGRRLITTRALIRAEEAWL